MNQKSSIRRLTALAALALLPGVVSAADYNYLEGGFIQRDTYGRSDAGVRVAGMLGIHPNVAAYSEFSNNDELNQFSAGAVFHTPINTEFDLFAGGGLEYVDIGQADDLGYGLRGGLRYTPSKIIELTPEVRYFNAVGDGRVALRLSGAYYIAPRFALVAAVQGGDDDRFEAGIRYRFGGV